MFLVILYLVISTLAEACRGGEAAANKCTPNKCESVGNAQICTSCETGNVPINGICKAKTDTAISTAGCKQADGTELAGTEQVCGQCGAGYFLYKGGCYAIGGTPGSTICSDTASPPGGTAGVCATCRADAGFFKNPSAANNKQSCIACGDTSIINDVTGVDGCTACKPPSEAGDNATPKAATCTACETTTPTYLKTVDGITTCVPKSDCNNGFFVEENATPKKCTACNDNANCATCTGASSNQCTRCKTTGDKTYLKVESGDKGTCVAASGCGPAAFPKDDAGTGNKCVSCGSTSGNDGGIADCQTCTKESNALKCLTCTTQTNKPNTDGTQCVTCNIERCTKCSKESVCGECEDGYKLEGGACVPAGTNLSTGAIAGISVAAVVVVGGLVGFLCWWFICRGKA